MENPSSTINRPPPIEEARLRTIILIEATVSGARASGPGGQNVNKRNTKAVLVWYPGKSLRLSEKERALILEHCASQMEKGGYFNITSKEQRGWHQNRAQTVEKLVELILIAIEPEKERKETAPTKASQGRRLDTKKKEGIKKAGRQWRPDHD